MSGILAEGNAAQINYKFYTSGDINSTTEPLIGTDPGASGGQVLRRVSSSLDLTKDSFESEEIRSDRQTFDMRHSTRRVQGDIAGELSPRTWGDFFQALTRGTWGTANVAITQATGSLTSVAAAASGSTITFGGGDPVVQGIRVGSIIRFTSGMTAVANNGVNFLVLSMGGTTNRTLTVFPTPVDSAASTTFAGVIAGRRLIVPSTGHVQRKVAVEHHYSELDLSRLFTECRVGSASIELEPSAPSRVSFGLMGRNMQILSGGSAPFFTAPTAETTTSIVSGVNGAILVNGVRQGVLTGLSMQIDLSPSAPAVIGQTIVPAIMLGRFRLTGTLTAFFENATLLNNFLNETDFSILASFVSGSGVADEQVTFFLPRVKASAGQLPLAGETEQILTLPFTALKAVGTGAGVEATTFQMVDTALV